MSLRSFSLKLQKEKKYRFDMSKIITPPKFKIENPQLSSKEEIRTVEIMNQVIESWWSNVLENLKHDGELTIPIGDERSIQIRVIGEF